MPSIHTLRTDLPLAAITGYTPTADDLAGLDRWWTTYDALAERSAIERMAALGAFPMNLVTDDAEHRPVTGQWSRDQYVDTMTHVMGDGGAGDAGSTDAVSFDSTRTPLFLGPSIVVVFSRSTMTVGGVRHQLDYADVLVRDADGWRFQTMIQPGWAEAMAG